VAREAAEKWYREYLEKHQCTYCNECHPATLDIRYKAPEHYEKTISDLVDEGKPLKEIFNELENCEVVCSNCALIIYDDNTRIKRGQDPRL
jgi:hypothetical protein